MRQLREAEVLGHIGVHKKLDEIRKSEAFKNPNASKNQADLGVLLRKLEPSSNDFFRLGMSNYDKDPPEALRNFLNAAKLNHKDANKKLMEIRKSTTNIGLLLLQVENESAGKDNDSKLKYLANLVSKDPTICNKETMGFRIKDPRMFQNLALTSYLKSDYYQARIFFQMLCKNPEASVKDKESARLKLAIKDLRGQGIDQPNYITAREGFRAIYKSKGASETEKVSAQFHLADMDIMGQGIAQPDYEAARKGFQAVCKNDKASAEDKAFAQFRLGVMDYLGEGTAQRLYETARQAFQASCDSEYVSDENRATATFMLAEMNFRGQGMPKVIWMQRC